MTAEEKYVESLRRKAERKGIFKRAKAMHKTLRKRLWFGWMAYSQAR